MEYCAKEENLKDPACLKDKNNEAEPATNDPADGGTEEDENGDEDQPINV